MPALEYPICPGEPHRVGAHPRAQVRVEVRRGRDLDDLLVAALHRAVALVQVDYVAAGVGEDLHLDVAGLDDGLLDEDGRVPERALRLAHAGLDRLAQATGLRRRGACRGRHLRPPP